jgi:DNA repair protein RadC
LSAFGLLDGYSLLPEQSGFQRPSVRCQTAVVQRLLAHHGGLHGLFRLDAAELVRVRGLGDAKAVRVKAALELGRRLAALSPEERPPVGSPEDVANPLSIEMAALEQEHLRVVLLDTKHRILSTRTVYQGSVNQKRISGPLLDRIDIHLDVPRIPHEQVADQRPGDSSPRSFRSASPPREIQARRFAGTALLTDANMGPKKLRLHAALDDDA